MQGDPVFLATVVVSDDLLRPAPSSLLGLLVILPLADAVPAADVFVVIKKMFGILEKWLQVIKKMLLIIEKMLQLLKPS